MSRTPPHRYGFVKLPGRSKRWRNEPNPDFAPGEIISDRKMSGLSRAERLGEHISKEKYTRGVQERRYERVDEARQMRATEGKKIRRGNS